MRDPAFKAVKDHITISTLNAYGYRRMHNQLNNTSLLSSNKQRYFAMKNQLRPIWFNKYPFVQEATVGRGNGARRLMNVMDDLKALGFDHTTDTNYDRFKARLDALQQSSDCLARDLHLSRRVESGGDAVAEADLMQEEGSVSDQRCLR